MKNIKGTCFAHLAVSEPKSAVLSEFRDHNSNIQFLFNPEVVKLHLPFPTLDKGTLVDQQLTFLVVNPDYGKVLEFSPPPAYSGMTPKGTANVFADSDGFLGIVAALCVKPFLCTRLVSDVRMSCGLPPI
ncbi:hypothetical protein AVEN_44433-1 [Araneus ventricosus]|uniref:Uncharacterized protein n=1 Tax=Araneus ventricosus TaxID=182803 RepID=A0A4Y2SX89_ARAVE|nr:hypothetical protein AVEN_44433-1 [Araneus ventricosus]